VWIVAPLLGGALLVEYGYTGRVDVGEVASVLALTITMLMVPE